MTAINKDDDLLSPYLTEELRTQRLVLPSKPSPYRVILDTDAYNEVDDQFAVAMALLSPDRMQVERIYAAPFHNERSDGPEDGMEKSYQELLRLTSLMGLEQFHSNILQGSRSFMLTPTTPIASEAAADLIQLAESANDTNPIYAIAIGAPTNIASALLAAPQIAAKIVVIWLGGHGHSSSSCKEFNLKQDIYASRVLFDSGVPLIQIPCNPVASHLITSPAELNHHIHDKNPVSTFLADIVSNYQHHTRKPGWGKVIWDIAAIGYLINPSWYESKLINSPQITDDFQYQFSENRHKIRVVNSLNRNEIFADLFTKLAAHNATPSEEGDDVQ